MFRPITIPATSFRLGIPYIPLRTFSMIARVARAPVPRHRACSALSQAVPSVNSRSSPNPSRSWGVTSANGSWSPRSGALPTAPWKPKARALRVRPLVDDPVPSGERAGGEEAHPAGDRRVLLPAGSLRTCFWLLREVSASAGRCGQRLGPLEKRLLNSGEGRDPGWPGSDLWELLSLLSSSTSCRF